MVFWILVCVFWWKADFHPQGAEEVSRWRRDATPYGFVKSRRRQEVVELKRGVGWIPKCINYRMPGALGGRGARSGFQLLSILSNLMLADLLS